MDSNSPSDADLVKQSLAGQREPFGQLYDRYARLVASVAAGVSGDWATAEDMTQETFLRAYRKLAKLREPSSFGPWVAGIARQVARERRRSLRRDRHEFHDSHSLHSTPLTTADTDLDNRDQTEAIMQRVAALGEQERLAIHAFYFDQQNALLAAEQLGISRSSFYATVQRAVARLATQLNSTNHKTTKRH